LIECNSNPYLGTPNAYMKELVPKMLDDMAKIVIDPHFEPKLVDDSFENGFEIIYSEEINKRGPFDLEYCYPIRVDSRTIDESIAQSGRSDAIKQSQLVTETDIPEFAAAVESDMIE
jgi:hypothetical protein